MTRFRFRLPRWWPGPRAVERVAFVRRADVEDDDPADWIDGAPTSARDQRCAFCGTSAVSWVHPLDPDKIGYRAWGKGYTLPSFWAVCDACESLYREGDDDALVVLFARDTPSVVDLDEDARKPIAVFRRADRGGRRFIDAN